MVMLYITLYTYMICKQPDSTFDVDSYIININYESTGPSTGPRGTPGVTLQIPGR